MMDIARWGFGEVARVAFKVLCINLIWKPNCIDCELLRTRALPAPSCSRVLPGNRRRGMHVAALASSELAPAKFTPDCACYWRSRMACLGGRQWPGTWANGRGWTEPYAGGPTMRRPFCREPIQPEASERWGTLVREGPERPRPVRRSSASRRCTMGYSAPPAPNPR